MATLLGTRRPWTKGRSRVRKEWWNFAKKGDSVWVTHFKHRSLHKYTRVARGQDSVEIKSMIDLVLVKRDMQ